jgi:cytochrome c5
VVLPQALAVAVLLLNGSSLADNPAYRVFEGPTVAQGRAIWLRSCEGCHGYGIAGAPIPMAPTDWRERLWQDQATLYRHAIEGFYGADDTVMPARGGDTGLTDDEVRAAVDYMTTLALSYIQQTETTP